jgi:nicotinate dehydrogenase subunit B
MKDNNNKQESSKKKTPLHFSRREFFRLLGGGIIIAFSIEDPFAALTETQQRRYGREYPEDFNAYLKIGEDGRVSCFTGKIEMGQGIIIALAQIMAEQLEVSLSSVDMVMGDTDLCPWDMGTFGSRSIKYFGPALREAAAEAKAVLIQLAAEHLNVTADCLMVKDGVVIDKHNAKNQVSYAQLAKGKKIERYLEKKPSMKQISEFTISGKSADRTDSVEKVTGKAQYAGDIRLPDMLYAKILRPPAHGGVLKSLDTSKIKAIKDVQVVQDGDLIAVLHPHPEEAQRAADKIKADYTLQEIKVDDQTIFEHLLEVAPEGEIVTEQGNLNEGRKLASITFEETYLNRYVAHAPIETHTAIAKVENKKATVWASTQRPFGAQEEVAQALGFSSENVRIITPFVGGGFGGKNQNKQVVEAARLAKLAGKPVQVAWSREEEFFNDTFQPAAVVKIASGLNESNQIVFWDYHIFFAGSRSSEPFYHIPHYKVISRGSWGRGAQGAHPFSVGAWRGPGSNTNTYARESHIDLMAAKAGIDPLQFRLMNLKDKRMIKALKTVADKFGWSSRKKKKSRGYGIACVNYLGTYVATMAEVEADKSSGSVQVKRVVCAQDMGRVINPEGAKLQIESCITMGLGYALAEEIHFKGGRIYDLNFDTYQIPRFSWLPKIETVLIDNLELAPQGGGEPAITCMGGVIANAVYDAIGVRLFQLPMTAERIQNAMKRDNAKLAEIVT